MSSDQRARPPDGGPEAGEEGRDREEPSAPAGSASSAAPPAREEGAPAAPEFRVPAWRPPPPGGQRGALLGLLAFCLFAALFAPAMALSWALPWGALVGSLLVLRRQRPLPQEMVTIGPAGLRCESVGTWTFTPWASVARLVDQSSTLVVHLASGHHIALDLAGRPDLRGILALAPSEVPYERADSAPQPGSGKKTLLLWVVLVVVMIAIWRLVGDR